MKKIKNILKSIMVILFFIGCIAGVMSIYALSYEGVEKAHVLGLLSMFCMSPALLYCAWRYIDDPGDLPF